MQPTISTTSLILWVENLRPKSQQRRTGTTTQPFGLQTLYYIHSMFACSGQLASIEWSLMWVQTDQFIPKPECTVGITFQTHPTCFQSKENKPMPQEFLQPQKSTPALPSPLLGPPKNQVAPATFKGENAFWCANIIAYSCIQNLILAARDFIIRYIIKISSQGLEACLFSLIYTSLELSECVLAS